MEHYRGHDIQYFISPAHFWFFAHCGKNPPPRPLRPSSLNDIFRHPIYLTADDKLHASLVVPEDFLTASARPDGSMNKTCYILPNFAQRLFEYAKEAAHLNVGPFSERYPPIKRLWLFKSEPKDKLLNLHLILRRHWRWVEVLEMLWGLKESRERSRCPPWCDIVNTNRLTDGTERKICEYLDIFGDMAKEWYIMPRPKRA